jgi:DNA-binding PadR family transcriptional regulator
MHVNREDLMQHTREPDAFLPLKPLVFHALLVLDEGEAHGYAIKKAVAGRTAGRIDLEPGTLYRLLARLLGQGLIEESEDRPDPDEDDERRRYYRITPLGHRVLAAEAARLAGLVDDEGVRALAAEGRSHR